MEKLIEILREFEENRKNAVDDDKWRDKSVEEKYEAIAEWFRPCAEKILCGGYFLINGKYIIDLGAIELYYHEEDGDIKDYIMYHTNAHSSKSKIYELNDNKYPYFEFGSFNLHQSGVDITFENEEKRYRASFLIRSYRVLRTKDGLYPTNEDTVYDPHSTHIFDDMFYRGISCNGKATEIGWIPTDKKGGEIDRDTRINVAIYEKPNVKDDKVYGSKDKIISEDDYINNDKKYIKINGKFYKRDERKWQFKLKNIIEKQ